MSSASASRSPFLYAMLVFSAIASQIGCARIDSKVETANIAESTLRSFATREVLPIYPANSSACGVVVAELRIDRAGKLKQATILEAPDKSTRDASYAAVSDWEFKPPSRKPISNVEYVGKLTFYFVSEHFTNGPAVFDPVKAPNIALCTDNNLQNQTQVRS